MLVKNILYKNSSEFYLVMENDLRYFGQFCEFPRENVLLCMHIYEAIK